jgi:hypothetical protein
VALTTTKAKKHELFVFFLKLLSLLPHSDRQGRTAKFHHPRSCQATKVQANTERKSISHWFYFLSWFV